MVGEYAGSVSYGLNLPNTLTKVYTYSTVDTILIKAACILIGSAKVDGMALSHNFSTQISDLEKLKRIAARAGFIQKRGAQKGEGSVRQLLEALIEGKAVVARTPEQNMLTEAERQDLALQEQLLAKGLISEIKPLSKRNLTPFNPIQVEGEPISQMIVRERR